MWVVISANDIVFLNHNSGTKAIDRGWDDELICTERSICMERTAHSPKGSKTRAHILKTAMDLFNTRGYHATRISDVMEASGVQKGNLYFYFRSKEDLAQVLIDEARREYMAYLHGNASGDSALVRLDNVLTAIYDLHVRKKFIGGCIFGNMALEMGDQNSQFREEIRAIFDEWVHFLSSLIQDAFRSGDLALPLEPEVLARHIVASLEGGIMLSRLSKDNADLKSALDAVRTLLQLGMSAGNDRDRIKKSNNSCKEP